MRAFFRGGEGGEGRLFPVRSKYVFRIFLRPGETKNVRFDVGPETLAMLDARLKKTIEPGDFQIMIGSSSADIRLRGILTVK